MMHFGMCINNVVSGIGTATYDNVCSGNSCVSMLTFVEQVYCVWLEYTKNLTAAVQ